jgi:adhesin transport system outer membrane protein
MTNRVFPFLMAAVTMSSGMLPFIGWHAQTLAAEPQAHITRHIQVKTSTLPQADVSDGPRSVTHAFTLVQVLDAVAAFYPSLVAARTEARASAQDVQAAERLRWPSVSATVESDTGNLRSLPNRAVQVDQTLWDAGRNTSRINEAKVLADISLTKVHLQQQEVFLQVTSAWQNMVSAKERLAVSDSTLERLKTYQAQMLRRVQAEASPVIDLELVNSRILQTEVEATAARTTLQTSVSRLEQFSGLENLRRLTAEAVYPVSLSDTASFNQQLAQTDWVQVVSDHPQVAKARQEVHQAKHRLGTKQAEAFPQLFARVYKPLNRLPNNPDTSTTAFIGLRYTPGAGFANVVEAQAINTRVLSTEQAVEAVMRETLQTLQNEQEEFTNARSRLGSLEKSVAGSEKVLESYQRQFQAGRKSWLDLLNAVRELAQNQYALADARASMVAAMYRLQIRSGQDVQ